MNRSNNSKMKPASKKKFKIVQKTKDFRMFDFKTFDVETDIPGQKTFRIQMFGINETGETVAFFVDDFQPFFYVKVPPKWDNYTVEAWFNGIKKSCGKYAEKDCLYVELETHSKLYEFTASTSYHFAKCVFRTNSAFNQFRRAVQNADEKMPTYESKIPPLLRYFHIYNISPSGWIQIKDNDMEIPDEKLTSCTYEYKCSIDQIKPLPQKETPVPYKIASFDIEASSSHGDFPVPIKDYKRMATQLIDVLDQKCIKQSMTTDAVNAWLKKAILSVFRIGASITDIDVVYPKVKPLKEEIKENIKTLLEKKMESEILNKESDTIKISEMFESAAPSESGGGDNTTNEAVQQSFAEELHANNKKPKKNKLTAQQKKLTIAEYLIHPEHTREMRIQAFNIALTNLFPELEGDEVTFIGTTFLKYGEKEPYKNHCLIVGSCDPVENVEICTVNNEKECLVEWAHLIQDENPDIIIGYNIFGFDYQFMFQRARELDCIEEFCSLSRIQQEICYKEDYETKEKRLDHTQNRLASGDYDLHYPPISGRLQIDLLFYFRRDYNMSSYKLDDVAGTMIRDDIKGVRVVNDTTHLYSKNLAGLHVDDFIHLEITSFTTDYYAGGRKFRVLHIEKNVKVENVSPIPDGTYNVIVIEGDHSVLDPKQINLKWGMAKDDVSPQDIFRLSKESAKSRAIVAKYCVQDCNLVHHLMNKVDTLTGYIEMARICNVPINFLVFRGQGIKLTSYVAKVCREKDTLMPDLEKTQNDDGYEGAIVLPPKCAMYGENPVACNDYSSLYPSIAKGWNLSPNSKVWTRHYDLQGKMIKINEKMITTKNRELLEQEAAQYDNVPGYQYINVTFDSFENTYRRTAAGGQGAKIKVKCGTKTVRWAQFPNGQEGIIPCIIGDLLKARKETRTKAENEPDPFLANVLDKRQLGYKVTANSLYGQMGSSVSTFFEKDVAASITAIGRMMITYAKSMVEEIYGNSLYTSKDGDNIRVARTRSQYVYGDSVASYTPICIKSNNTIDIITIDDIANKYGQGKWTLCTEEGKQEKEFCELIDVQSWTEKGWTPLYRVIRHKLADHKKMVRVLTHTGMVDVTDDHSLLTLDGNEISPTNLHIGSELLHHKLPIETNITNITAEEARIMGFFMGDGSCGKYDCPSGRKNSWVLNNANIDRLQYYQSLCESVYGDYTWCCLQTMESSGVYKLVPKCETYGAISKLVETYCGKMYSKDRAKVIPLEVMNGSIEIRQAFFDGLYDADGDKDTNGYVRIDQKNQISASHICFLAQSLGWNTSINTRQDKPNVYRITMTKRTQRKNPNAIKKMHTIEYTDYVYDLTTENHHFSAGIGSMIVHNTDSVFFTFNLEDPETGAPIRGREALKWTIEIAEESARLCSLFLPPPMKLAYEKTLMSFILLSKKRYVGMLYEYNPDKGKLKFMGLPLKRRDACDYLKDVYGGILTILMKEPDNVEKAIEFLNKSLKALVDGTVSMDKLALTKSLRSDYKNPKQIAHKVLADRIGEREPGNKPKPGDRVKYAFIENKDEKLLGNRVETPQFITENGLKLDYHYYITNQLMNPLLQLFSLALDKVYLYKGKRQKDVVNLQSHLDKLYENCANDLELYMKKREKHCSAEVKQLLFDPFLTEIYNTQNGIQTLLQFYKKRAC